MTSKLLYKHTCPKSDFEHHILPDVIAPVNWKNILLKGVNKAGLAKFYTECIIENKSSLNDQQVIIISGGQQEKVVKVTNAAVHETLEPTSNHE